MLKRWQFWLGLIMSAIFFYIVLSNMELDQVWLALKTARYWWIIPGVAVYFFGVWSRTWRWHYLLRPMLSVPLARLFPVVCIGYMGNNVYPARAGEVIRAYVLRKKEGVSISASLATIVVERIFDGVVMLLFVFFSLPFVPMQPWLRQVVILASLLFFGALAVFFVLAISPHRSQVVYVWHIDRVLPVRFRGLARGLLSRFVGMLTDSRSFLSFSRHEYFRRLLCNLLGNDVKRGLLPDDRGLLGQLVADVCFHNADRYFDFESAAGAGGR